jgi:hypothetical protein
MHKISNSKIPITRCPALFARRPVIMGQVLGIVYRVISMHLVMKAGYSKKGIPHWRGKEVS